jgi:Tol biopolymer transport system component
MSQAVSSPAWTPNGGDVIFSSGTHVGQRRLWRTPASPASRDRSSPDPVPIGEGSTSLAISSSARRLIFSREFSDTNIWRVDLRSPGEAEGPPSTVAASTYMDYNPDYSPDGRKIVFNSQRSGSEEIWVANADGSGPVQLTSVGAL